MSDIANALNRVFSDTTYTTKAAEKLHKVTILVVFVSTKNILKKDERLDAAECYLSLLLVRACHS